MLITEVKAFPLSCPAQGPLVTLGTGTAIKTDVILVRVRTEDGIVGWGEAHHALAPTVIADLVEYHLGPLVVGEDALEVEHIWDKLYMSQGRTHSTGWGVWIAMSGINTAIWDARGKALGLPVYQLLGGKKKPIRAYLGGIALGYQAPESLAEEALVYIGQGYTALKLRLGDTPRLDIARVRAVRAAVGDGVDLMTDVNTKYGYQQMLQLLPALEECGVYWIEEPFPPDALRDYSLLAARTRIPLAAGENHFLRYQARQFLETEAVQIVQSDVAKCGGISEHKKIADLAAAFRRPFAPHTSVSAVSHAATLHVTMACSNALIYEAGAPNPFKGEVVHPSPRVGPDGYVEPGDEPGLGVEVDESLFGKYPVHPGPVLHLMRELRIAMVGAGFMGKAHSLAYAMAPVAFGLPVRLRRQVVVDVSDDLAAAAARDFGFEEAHTDWRTIIERDDIDVVDIVTPNDSHEAIAVAAAERGKHVLCEKPLALDAASAERMARHAERAGVVNMVGFNYRHTPAIAYARQLIAEGQLGTPYQVRMSYLQDWAMLGAPHAWRFDSKRAGSGAIGDIGSHAIDCAEHLLGPISRVFGRLATFTAERPLPGGNGDLRRVDVDDAATFLADFESGATGVFVATRYALARKNQLAFELDAARGALRFNWDARDELQMALIDDPAPVSGFRLVSLGPTHPLPWWPIAGMGSGYLETSTNQIREFVAAIVSGGLARPNFADGAHVQRVVDAVVASAHSGAWVDVTSAVGAGA